MSSHKTKNHWLLSVRPAFLASFLKRLLRIRRRVVTADKGRFFVDPASHFGNTVLTTGEYEPEMFAALKSTLREGDVFLDVGANEGYFSIVASGLVGDRGTVLTVEPQSRLQSVIFRNIAENGAFNVHTFQAAIADTTGTASLSLLPDMNTGGSGLFRMTNYAVPTETIPSMTLSRFCNLLSVDRIRLMKIDVEGFEYEAILGSKELFAGNLIENIALELHPSILSKRGKSEQEILDFLVANGYEKNTTAGTLIMQKRLDMRS